VRACALLTGGGFVVCAEAADAALAVDAGLRERPMGVRNSAVGRDVVAVPVVQTTNQLQTTNCTRLRRMHFGFRL